MKEIEDSGDDLCGEKRISSEGEKACLAMRRRLSEHLAPDIGQLFLDGGARGLLQSVIGFGVRCKVQLAHCDDSELAGLEGGSAGAPLNFPAGRSGNRAGVNEHHRVDFQFV
jgi:hypothetical protein